MGRVVVIGDVGGHLDQLRYALSSCGAHGDQLCLPLNTTVIQIGDLVDRGPDSSRVLTLVNRYLENQPAQWIQLVGNHEAQYLPGGTRFWAERLTDRDANLLRSWWEAGSMQVAAGIRLAEGDELLLTHAGLTVDAWRALSEPMTVTTAAYLLNDRPEPLIWLGDGFTTDTLAGPLWAEAGPELCEPWLRFHAEGSFVPFGQVHGHSSIVSFTDRVWHCPGRIRQRTAVDWQARHVRVRIGGQRFIGIDPRHGQTGAAQWQPLVFDDAEVLVGAGRHPLSS